MALSPVPVWLLFCFLLSAASGVFSQDLDVSPPLVNFDCSDSTPQLLGTGGTPIRLTRQTLKRTMWPWMALMGSIESGNMSWSCAGMLINEQWVLTAGQCTQHLAINVVRLGEYDFSDDADGAPHQDYGVAETVLHPDYKHGVPYHDLALIKLNSTVEMQRFVGPLCLPWGEESNVVVAGQQGLVLSFENYFLPDVSANSIQKEISMKIFSGEECSNKYADFGEMFSRGMGDVTLCAADLVDGRDACWGDSGGPLVTQDRNEVYVAAGIVLGGANCGTGDFPSYYANLRYPSHLAWIKKVAFSGI